MALSLILVPTLQAQESDGGAEYSIETNLAYIALGAFSSAGGNVFIVAPLYSQLRVFGRFSVDLAAAYIYNSHPTLETPSAMILAEAGASYHPSASIGGWTFGLLPGFVYSFDSRTAGFSASLNCGYKWVIGNGLILGALTGARYVWIDGYIVLPDLAISLGYRL
ncbi:MAG TPA: hypothetical protein P5298_01705 [Spirochaetia bacterium]|nr:hypothetical protein [Spirochaetaceae bacterium]HPE88977.1 hypothetical protein [Spirochaetales bacterium]HRW23109.1 hypothetical protein [Spirochaetia bacterium]